MLLSLKSEPRAELKLNAGAGFHPVFCLPITNRDELVIRDARVWNPEKEGICRIRGEASENMGSENTAPPTWVLKLPACTHVYHSAHPVWESLIARGPSISVLSFKHKFRITCFLSSGWQYGFRTLQTLSAVSPFSTAAVDTARHL